jgi:hypothetical protein
MKFSIAALSAAALLAAVSPAKADVLFDSLNGATGGTASIPGPAGNPNFIGASFSTGSSPFLFTGLTLDLAAANPSDGGVVEFDLARDHGASPGDFLDFIGSFNDSALSTTPTAHTFSLTSPISLAADTRYWIVITGYLSSSAKWAWTNDTAGTGVANEYYYDNGVYPNSDGPYQMEVSGTAVPEPASAALLAAGLLSLGALRRRKAA